MDSTVGGVSIPTAVDRCARSFLSLVETLQRPTRFADQVPAESILDEFDRFKLWAGNIAAHRKGRRSLEYRLRDAAQLRFETHDLLASLSRALDDATAIVEEVRVPWDEETFSDSDSDWSDGEDDSNNGNALQGSTELKQLHARSRSTITSLMRLTMAIREPAPNRQALRIDKSYHEPYDVQHVQAKFGNSDSYLTERLGRATSSRRQYFAYREKHCQKLSKGIETLGFEEQRTEHTDNSTEATSIPALDPASQPESSISNLLDDRDETLSRTSYASSFRNTIRTPRLPKDASKCEPYECPLCFSLIAIYTSAAWKRHVYQDLHPYCCTFEDCPTADRLYDSRHAWFEHELEAHRTSFQCIEGCDQTFTAEPAFQIHVQRCHPDLAIPAVYSALKRTSARSANLSEQAICKLCKESTTLRRLRKHLGQHQEQLALFALPAAIEESDVDPDDFDRERPRFEDEDEDEIIDPGKNKGKAAEHAFLSGQEGSEDKFARLERLILAQHDERIKREAAAEAAAEAKKKSDEDRLARLEKLILAQKDEQLKREAAAEAVRRAASEAADAEAEKIAQEKKEAAVAASLLLAAAKNAREQAERKAAADAEATRLMHEKALAEAKAAATELEEAKRAAKEAAAKLKPSDALKAPIRFTDAVGRKFSFPWRLCKTWKGMEELIKQAFLHVDVLGPHVHQGHYDLVGPDGEIILPQVWETMVQPDCAITMHMWPMPEPRDDAPETLRVTVSRLKPRKGSNSISKVPRAMPDSTVVVPPPPPPPPSKTRDRVPPPPAPSGSRPSNSPIPALSTKRGQKPVPRGFYAWAAKGKARSNTTGAAPSGRPDKAKAGNERKPSPAEASQAQREREESVEHDLWEWIES